MYSFQIDDAEVATGDEAFRKLIAAMREVALWTQATANAIEEGREPYPPASIEERIAMRAALDFVLRNEFASDNKTYAELRRLRYHL